MSDDLGIELRVRVRFAFRSFGFRFTEYIHAASLGFGLDFVLDPTPRHLSGDGTDTKVPRELNSIHLPTGLGLGFGSGLDIVFL